MKIQWYGGRYGTGDDELWYNTEYMYIGREKRMITIMRPGTVDAISKGPSQGKARDYARKISPFNLTAPAYLNRWK